MDRTIYSQTLSEARENDTLFDSRYTHLTEQQTHNNWFSQQRTYSKAVLSTWGLQLGEMSYSRDNEQTLRCILELITYHQKDLQFRAKVKEDITSISFERDKYRSFMEQAQRSLQEMTRRLGKSENECAEMRNRQKKGEATSKKQKEEDKKMIAMLRAKNEQIMHQVKKKQQEVHRIKEQMKKSVGQKTISYAKNSFQVFQNLSPSKKQTGRQQEVKYALLAERNEKEMAHAVRENTILREKIFEIREELLNFNQWIDRQLFGQTDTDKFKRNTRFPFNHNLLFKKESLTEELADLIETAKDGLRQMKELYRAEGGLSQKKSHSSNVLPPTEEIEELDFKKKMRKVDSIKSDRPKAVEPEDFRQQKQTKPKKFTFGKAMGEASANVTPKSFKKIYTQEQQTYRAQTAKKLGNIDSNAGHRGRVSFQQSKPPFEDELLSDVGDGQQSSIVSHIEVQKLGKNRFDKWDILYDDTE